MVQRLIRSFLLLVLLLTLMAPGAVISAALININTATAEQLQQVQGIGPSTAEKIVAYRQQHGAFTSLDQLVEIKGIGEKSLAKISGQLSLEQ
ncbi:MAG: helix-hairpin-helix domain-containing protein [Desulfuromonadaceae bacterium]|nr:helix-hairpin-helix domain-containing protein [Desulfuromonadaceae bacterium]